MQNTSKHHFCFYSTRCKYSLEVLSLIKNYQLNFVLVNIDNPNYKIPQFVDRVPLVYIQETKEIIIDDNIVNYINNLNQPKQQQTQQPIEYMSDVNKSISNSFSFISENDDTITPLGYGIIGATNTMQQQNENDSSNKTNKLDSKVFENYKSQRDSDIAQFMPPRSI